MPLGTALPLSPRALSPGDTSLPSAPWPLALALAPGCHRAD